MKLREQLGLTVDPEKEFRHRDAEKQGLKKAFEREGLNASAASASTAIRHRRKEIARLFSVEEALGFERV